MNLTPLTEPQIEETEELFDVCRIEDVLRCYSCYDKFGYLVIDIEAIKSKINNQV